MCHQIWPLHPNLQTVQQVSMDNVAVLDVPASLAVNSSAGVAGVSATVPYPASLVYPYPWEWLPGEAVDLPNISAAYSACHNPFFRTHICSLF